jgi:hypothetical protein
MDRTEAHAMERFPEKLRTLRERQGIPLTYRDDSPANFKTAARVCGAKRKRKDCR